jgi:serine/threonine-protein kinase
MADVFAIQNEIAQKIADQLQAKISAREKAAIEKQPTRDVEAYKLYVEAMSLISMNSGDARFEEPKKNYLRAVELLNQAIVRDPAFLLAYSGLEEAHTELYFLGLDPTPARLALAKSAIDSAFKLQPDSGEVHAARAHYLYHGYLDYDHARDELDLARRTLPNNSRIYEWSGLIDRRQNRWHDAVRDCDHAVELDPQNVKVLNQAMQTSFLLRDYDKVNELQTRIAAFEPKPDPEMGKAWRDLLLRADTRALHAVMKSRDGHDENLVPSDRFRLTLWERNAAEAERLLPTIMTEYGDAYLARDVGYTTLSRDYLEGLIARMRGDVTGEQKAFTAARSKQEEAIRASPDLKTRLLVLGLIDAALGRKADALREGREAVELLPPDKEAFDAADARYYYAVICAWVGERDLAIEQLQVSAKMPAGVAYHEIRLDPHWDPLRDDPRFEKIAASLAPKTSEK